MARPGLGPPMDSLVERLESDRHSQCNIGVRVFALSVLLKCGQAAQLQRPTT